MKPFRRVLASGRLLGLLLVAAFGVLRAIDPLPLPLQSLQNFTFDIFQRWKPRVETNFPARIVDIDEKSLKEIGQWPWPRSTIAELIDRVAEAGAVTVAFDAVFAEPDRLSPERIAQALPKLDEATRAKIAELTGNEQQMAAAMRRVRVVLGEMGSNDAPDRPGKPRSPVAFRGGDPIPFLDQFPKLLGNVPEIDTAAAGRGLFTYRVERDDVVRRMPAVQAVAGAVLPTLPIEAMRVATNTQTILLSRNAAGISSLVIAGIEIPTDRHAYLWLHFTPKDQRRYVSATDVLARRIPPNALRGRIAIVGASAAVLFDRRATPLDTVVPGAEIHAQAIESIAGKALLTRFNEATEWEIAIAVAIGLTVVVLVPWLGALPVLLLTATLLALIWGGAWHLFSARKLLVDPSFATLTALATLVLMSFQNYRREERQKAEIRGAFSHYVAPAIVEQLAADPKKLVLGGETRELTVLFTDVRGFTTISETFKDDPQGLTQLMNRMLTPLTNAIIESGGTIDKYMGDAILAFWNAPLDTPDHAKRALGAALEMLKRLEALNATLAREAEAAGRPHIPIEIGIGLNTGPCVVGNMGSDLRFDYSVLGDSVNIASRLEGLTKSYGVSILAGSSTVAAADDAFAAIAVDTVRVKGKTQPETIHAVLGEGSLKTEPAVRMHAEAMAAYRSAIAAGDVQAARRIAAGAGTGPLASVFALHMEKLAKLTSGEDPAVAVDIADKILVAE